MRLSKKLHNSKFTNIENIYSKSKNLKINPRYFTGAVKIKEISSVIKSKEQKVYHVTFFGSKTKVHSHDGGQILIVTKGQGSLSFYKKIGKGKKKFSIKKTRDIRLRLGDVTYIPAKILHVHGSIGKKMMFSHIALNSYPAKNKEPKTIWFESDFESKVTSILE
ncbi:MAG TPA: cupin domain-containing protein [Nitrosopumilaceae archaeon]|nr:cupin domain-containing protein [Nitrosopumilaceae archaeon]